MHDKKFAPAAARNVAAIEAVICPRLAPTANVLEIGSGTGQHLTAFAAARPDVDWQPSDADDGALASIAAWRREAGLQNLRAPISLDLLQDGWADRLTGAFDCIYSANVIHISPWQLCLNLLAGAAHLLKPEGEVLFYGPFKIGGADTAPSNRDFDQSLRQRDPAWGVRDLDDITAAAATVGLGFRERIAMPANNFIVVFSASPGRASS